MGVLVAQVAAEPSAVSAAASRVARRIGIIVALVLAVWFIASLASRPSKFALDADGGVSATGRSARPVGREPSTTAVGLPVPTRRSPAPGEGCALRPQSGDILFARTNLTPDRGHTIEIQNGSAMNAIVKLREPKSDRTVISFFVASSSNAIVEGIPDGVYRVLFALGDWLDKTCTNFDGQYEARSFPGVERLKTQSSATETTTTRLSFTLHAVPRGNIQVQPMSTETFSSD